MKAWSIPACAGNRPRRFRHLPSTRSIPRVRGNQRTLANRPNTLRSIPAVCGGTELSDRIHQSYHGLSPRVRGNQYLSVALPATLRSIPRVCGGTTNPDPRVCGGTRPLPDASSGLSPRVRGNHRHGPEVYGYGLSPRVRGNLNGPPSYCLRALPRCAGNLQLLRSIPACAGEPRHTGLLCGEPSSGPRSASTVRVRVRGNIMFNFTTIRSIPACAGEPTLAKTRPTAPRVRGTIILTCVRQGEGVYPRVCGGTFNSLDQLAPAHSAAGSIPACAGEPA